MQPTTNVRPGQTIAFVYNAGSQSGARRLVLVAQDDPAYVAGQDVEKNEYRRFNRDKIAGIPTVVADEAEEVIPLAQIFRPEILADLDQKDPGTRDLVVRLYQSMYPRRKGVRYGFTGFIVARRIDLPRVELSVDAKGVDLSFVNEGGRRFGLHLDVAGAPELGTPPYTVRCLLDQKVIEDFASQLAGHFLPGSPERGATSPPLRGPMTGAPKPGTPLAGTQAQGWSDHVVQQQRAGNGMYADVEAAV